MSALLCPGAQADACVRAGRLISGSHRQVCSSCLAHCCGLAGWACLVLQFAATSSATHPAAAAPRHSWLGEVPAAAVGMSEIQAGSIMAPRMSLRLVPAAAAAAPALLLLAHRSHDSLGRQRLVSALPRCACRANLMALHAETAALHVSGSHCAAQLRSDCYCGRVRQLAPCQQ